MTKSFPQHVAAILMPNGKRYAQLDTFDVSGGKFVHADLQFVYYYDETTNAEAPLYNLQASVGESWEAPFGPTTEVSLVEIDTVLVFNEDFLRSSSLLKLNYTASLL